MPTIKVNDLSIYYEINGNGPPLVLLPGLMGTLESDWRRFIPALAGKHQTIAVDLRGHGRTDNPDSSDPARAGELDLDLMADDLNGLIDKLGFKSVAVLGYSLGGCTALLAGLRRPGHIQALVMHATKFFWNEDAIASMVAGLDPETILTKTPRYAQTLQQIHGAVYGVDYWQILLKRAARFVKTMPQSAPGLKEASTAGFPILVSAGDHDQLVSLEEAARLFRALPAGELAILPATRHPIKSVRVESLVALVEGFLEKSENRNAFIK
jgi:pimeloyl-ACP methyl ester carboxylesterase